MNKESEDEGWDLDEDDWGGAPVQKEIKLNAEEIHTKNLNKLSDTELAAHKKAMDRDFSKN